MRKKLDYEYCSASPILEWLGDKWALVVLLKLHENGVIRFNELYKTIPSISEKMLSTVLRSLALLFQERLTGRQMFCFVMSTLGLVLVIGVSGGAGAGDTAGVLFGLGAAVFYAAVVLCNKGIRNVTGINRTYLQFLASIAVLLPYVLFTGGFHLAELPAKGLASLLVVGVGYTGIAYTLYFSSLRYLKGQEAAILSYIDPLVAVLVSVTVLAESVTWLQAAGGAMILGFTILNELKPKGAA